MAIKKDVEETLVVEGTRDTWIARVEDALNRGGFKKVKRSDTLGQVTATLRKMTVVGDIFVTLTPTDDGQRTHLSIKARGNVDNVFALKSSPGQKIIDRLKTKLA